MSQQLPLCRLWQQQQSGSPISGGTLDPPCLGPVMNECLSLCRKSFLVAAAVCLTNGLCTWAAARTLLFKDEVCWPWQQLQTNEWAISESGAAGK